MSQRVMGSALKPALQVAAAKQVAAGGVRVKASQVTFTGKQAYAVWDEQRVDWSRPDRAFRVNYPALSDDASLSRVEADLISAYTLHETGHVLYTCNDSCGIENLCRSKGLSRELVHPISNGLEDGRMENAVINAGVARNAKYMFGRLLNKLTADMPSGWNPCDFAHSAFALALLAREAYGNGNSTTAGLLDRIPEPKRSLYAWAMDQCRWAPKGYDNETWAYSTAAEFILKWREIEAAKPEPKKPPPPPPEGEDGEPCGEPSEETGKGKAPKEEDEDLDLDGDDHDDSLGDREFEDDDEADGGDEADEDGGDDAGSGGRNDPFDNEEGEEEEAEGGEGDEGDEEEEGDPSSGESDSGGSETFDFEDLGSSSGSAKSAEPCIDEIFKRANKRVEGGTKGALGQITPAPFEDPMQYIKDRAPGGVHSFYNETEYS